MTRILISIIGVVIGLMSMFVVALSKSLVEGADIELVNEVIEYVSIVGDSNLSLDIEIMLILMKINEYSHLILTIGIIWITLFLYVGITKKKNVNNY